MSRSDLDELTILRFLFHLLFCCDHGRRLIFRIDDIAQPSAASWFGSEADTGRPKVWREIGVSGVGEL